MNRMTMYECERYDNLTKELTEDDRNELRNLLNSFVSRRITEELKSMRAKLVKQITGDFIEMINDF